MKLSAKILGLFGITFGFFGTYADEVRSRDLLTGMMVKSGVYDTANAQNFVAGLEATEVNELTKMMNNSAVVFSSKPVEWTSGQ